MQFHQDGFRLGDPNISGAAEGRLVRDGDALPAEVDVLIVGCGPAGLTLAAQLAAFPDIRTLIVDQKPGPLQLGQADGIACRTMEMFEAFGFSERVLKESYWVNETVFWRPDDADRSRIVRSGRVQDTEDGLSEFPHVILNQARVHDFYLDVMRNAPARLEPAYGRKLLDVAVDEAARSRPGAHAATARFESADAVGETRVETVRARYVVGCDGARSAVRRSLGLELRGDSANQAWGVMDVLAVTDFPDIRFKALIQSASEGSIVIIPREGGHLVRLYIELDKLAAGERVAARNITSDHLVAAARRILNPHKLDVREIAWWSVYEIGQRLCDRFDDVPPEAAGRALPRVFIAGDACHTHSPKAGQGMNVSMQDAFNLGWKLASVLRGQADPMLLSTYSAERQAIAGELIDFDREWAKLLSQPARRAGDPDGVGVDPAETQRYFVRHGRYTAGTATLYTPSLLTRAADHQQLATGFPVGMRFHSAPVVRMADARPMELGHAARADGRWRLFAFAGRDGAGAGSRLAALCDFLENSPASPVRRYTPAGAGVDAVIDVRAVLQEPHDRLSPADLPALLRPATGKLGLTDYEKVYCANHRAGDIYDLRGIDRDGGCIVLSRPDQYVAAVLPLDAHAALAGYFDAFMREPQAVRPVRETRAA
jgi:2-polyprenyl-6-methoxyphenol hydroxylase-like FAD-dependent oxidoreductase